MEAILPRPVELVELRDERTKHYLTGYDADGAERRVAEKRAFPIHYRKGDRWLDINPVWRDWGLDGVGYHTNLYGIGCTAMRLLDGGGSPSIEGCRVWWRGVLPHTDAVLKASGMGLQLHLIVWGPAAPRSWRFWVAEPDKLKIGGRDNIQRWTERDGAEQNYELEIRHEVEGHVVTKTWTGRVLEVDPVTRVKRWSDNVAYPVRVI